MSDSTSVKGTMTEGEPLPLILRFALPLLLGNLLQQTYNLMDAAIVGRVLGTGALAAVGATSSIQFLVLGFCTGSCSGFGVPVAKYFGAKDYDHMKKCVYHGAVICMILAAVITGITTLLCHGILNLLSTPEDIYDRTYVYLLIIFIGIPFTFLYNYLSGILRAVGNSKAPFVFLAFSSVLNIGLDLLCIAVFHLGVAGAAIATISSQAISGGMCLIYILKKVPILHLEKKNKELELSCAGEMLIMGIPMGLQFSITAIGSMVMQAANNGLGSIYVSGFTAGTKIKQFFLSTYDALGTGVSVFCSQNLGAGRPDRIRKGFLQGLFAAVCYGVIAGMCMAFGGRVLSMLFVSGTETAILDASADYLRLQGYLYFILAFLNISRMTVQGLGFAGRAILSGAFEMVARVLVGTFLVERLGYTAVCIADPIAWVFAILYILPMCLWCIKKIFTKYGKNPYNGRMPQSNLRA